MFREWSLIGYGVFILSCGWAGMTVYKSISNLPPVPIKTTRKPGFDVPKFITNKLSDPKFAIWVISPTCVVIVLVVGAGYFGLKVTDFQDNFSDGVLASNRNFYGVIRVIESSKGKDTHRYKMYHG